MWIATRCSAVSFYEQNSNYSVSNHQLVSGTIISLLRKVIMTDGKESTGPPARKKLAVDGDADTAKESITSSEEIASGARRLAKELREFIIAQKEKTGDSSNISLDMQYGNLSLSSEENIVDLQMATCRKLREVRTGF